MKGKTEKHVVVLGAGSCGLSAGWKLAQNGCRVSILENEADIGGLTGRMMYGNNIYEYGTHVFHTDSRELKKDLKNLLGPYMFEFERGSRLYIKFQDKYFRYPLNSMDFIQGLPLGLLAVCAYDFLKYNLMDQFKKEYSNAEEILTYKFGKKLYEIFFKDYTAKQWGLSPTEIDVDLVRQRITRGDVFRVVKEFIEKLGLGPHFNSHPQTERSIGQLYYTEDGIWGICCGIAQFIKANNGKILLNTRPIRIVNNVDKIFVEYESNGGTDIIEADHVISSIPLPVFIEILSDVPWEIRQAARRLRYRAMVVLGMLIDKKQVTEAICFYFRDKVYNRLAEPTNHGLRVSPSGKSILLAELACNFGDDVWDFSDELAEEIINDIVSEGLLDYKNVLEMHKLRYRYAYPIYHAGYKKDVVRVLDYLEGVSNVQSVGRQGAFNYVNMHVTMQMGIESARAIIED